MRAAAAAGSHEAVSRHRIARFSWRGLLWIARQLYPFAVVLIGWELLATFGDLSVLALPAPAEVLERCWDLIKEGELLPEAGVTLRRILAAWLLAALVGITLGIVIGRSRWAAQALRPLVRFLFPTPKIVLYPAFLIVLGLGTSSKIALGMSEALFPILLATAAAASQVEPRLIWSARALGTSPRQSFARIVLPAATPGIFSGLRIGLVGAIAGVFLGEMIAGSDGLGHQMTTASRLLRTTDMYVAFLTMALMGFLLDRTIIWVRARVLVWSDE